MSKWKAVFAVAGLSVSLLAGQAGADATVTLRGIDDAGQTLIQVRDGMVRMGDAGDPQYTLFDQSQNRLIHVDGRNGVYTEMDLAMMKQQSAEMADMLAMQMAQMQALPAEQRAMMEAQMGGMPGMPAMGGGAGAMPSVRAESRGGRVIAGVNCEAYALFSGTSPAGEACVAEAGDVKMSAKDFATLMAMMDLMRDLTRSMPMMGDTDPLLMSDLKGLPVELHGVSPDEDFTLQSIFSGPLDAGLFESYKVLRRQDAMADDMSDHMMDDPMMEHH